MLYSRYPYNDSVGNRYAIVLYDAKVAEENRSVKTKQPIIIHNNDFIAYIQSGLGKIVFVA